MNRELSPNFDIAGGKNSRKLSDITNPSATIDIIESEYDILYDGIGRSVVRSSYYNGGKEIAWPSHEGTSCNACFLDGHADTIVGGTGKGGVWSQSMYGKPGPLANCWFNPNPWTYNGKP
jgi:prepilin-type processing-associated H-X9-DG protein